MGSTDVYETYPTVTRGYRVRLTQMPSNGDVVVRATSLPTFHGVNGNFSSTDIQVCRSVLVYQ